MIPKVIHYCWFGGSEKPKSVLRCIASWKRFCPNYEIIEWNENNFDVFQNDYLKYCYDNKKWAFLSDLARLIIIYEHGGLYFDTDVELVKSPDPLLDYDAFYGFETKMYINTGLGFGAVSYHRTVKSMIELYKTAIPEKDGSYSLITCPQLNTRALLPYGLQTTGERQIVEGAVILPVEYLNPYDDPKGILKRTENTISIHWYSKSWMDRKTIIRSRMTQPFHRLFGEDCFHWLKKKS